MDKFHVANRSQCLIHLSPPSCGCEGEGALNAGLMLAVRLPRSARNAGQIVGKQMPALVKSAAFITKNNTEEIKIEDRSRHIVISMVASLASLHK